MATLNNHLVQNHPNDRLDSQDDEIFRNLDSQHQPDPVTSNLNSGSDEDENEIDKQDAAHNEYVQTDPIRRFQFDYDEHVALSNEFPAAHIDGHALTKKNHGNRSKKTILQMLLLEKDKYLLQY